MDFFKSVFSDETEASSETENSWHFDSNSPTKPDPQQNSNPNPSSSSATWSFGGLIKNLASRSESVIKIYRRDLEEFRSGLEKETEAVRDVSSGAVHDIPVSLEAGASLAQGSLASVGHALRSLDEFCSSVWRGTVEIISDGKIALQDLDSGSSSQNSASTLSYSKHYSRFDLQVFGIQSDPGTYSDKPEDLEDFEKWKLGFDLEEKEEEIENLLKENGAVEGIYSKLVPRAVDHETFWGRYFYRICKLRAAEDARANLVRRAISMQDDEELSWEVDDNDEEETTYVPKKGDLNEEKIAEELKQDEKNAGTLIEESSSSNKGGDGDNLSSVKETVSVNGPDGRLQLVEKDGVDSNSPESVVKSNEKMAVEEKNEEGESSKDGDLSIVSSHQSAHEMDLGWDEIADLGSIDEKRVSTEGCPSREFLQKRLSAADEEDLSWDIEDEEPDKH